MFTGSHIQRQAINLGGSSRQADSGAQPGDLIKRAKREREERELNRKKDTAAAKIQVSSTSAAASRDRPRLRVACSLALHLLPQVFYTGRRHAARTRTTLRAKFDSLLADSPADPNAVVHATRLLAVFFVDRNQQDLKRAGAWCRAVIGTVANSPGASSVSQTRPHAPSLPPLATAKTPIVFALFGTHSESWPVLVRQMSNILLSQAALHPA